jgi:UDP-N-acetylglucosamine:LPS N-acetylglucosamine transferase
MAKILMTWELGAGLGHMAPLRPLVEELLGRGHQVSLALRNLARAPMVFRDLPVRFYQAPFYVRRGEAPKPPAAYIHLLENIGFRDTAQVATLLIKWRAIFDEVRPDLLLCEHSPTALLAARGYSFSRVVFGNGFYCPPGTGTLTMLRPWLKVSLNQVREDEERLTLDLNRILDSVGGRPLNVLSDLYRQVDETFVTTFAELDHFDRPQPCEYRGIWTLKTGDPFDWPPGDGPRVFAYLKPGAALDGLLRELRVQRLPTLVYADGLDGKVKQDYASVTLRFVDRPLDMTQVGAECDLGVCNANHSTTAMLLKAGKRLLLLPIALEQYLLGSKLDRQGMAVTVPPNAPSAVVALLQKALDSNRLRSAANDFAERHAYFDAARSVAKIADRIEQLL